MVHYESRALKGAGTFLLYLPPGIHASTAHYPVLYLLHGNDQLPSAFLQIGLQEDLDQLISSHTIPPMIAVMIQGGRGANNWRNYGPAHYETYVLETQELVDTMLPTIAERGARAIAGLSMGGYGAMAIALEHPARFSVVESWLGFFDGLSRRSRRTPRSSTTRGCARSSTAAHRTPSPTRPRTRRSQNHFAKPERRPRATSTPAGTTWKRSSST